MTERPLIYNKLVRDLIPDQIKQSGKYEKSDTLNQAEFTHALKLKLLEEAHELFHADNRDAVINESADLLELIETLLKQHNISLTEVQDKQKQKRDKVGSFDKRLMLYATATDPALLSNPITNQIKEPRLPQLLTFNSVTGLVDVIKRELEDADALYIASAFYSRSMLNLLLDPFLKFIKRGGELKLLTSIMGNFNNPNDLKHLSTQLADIKVKIFYPLDEFGNADFSQTPPPFHVKSFLFTKATGQHALIVGSSNLTESGLSRNHEWNYFSNSEPNLILKDKLSAFQYAQQEYQHYWEQASIPVDDDFIAAYLPRWQKAHELRTKVSHEMAVAFKTTLAPRPAQIQALSALADRRAKGINKTTVIAATGLGKTYLAAFDYKASGMKSLLFIAHRENILLKALETFREVTQDPHFGSVLSGNQKTSTANPCLFAMVQTLSQTDTLAQYADTAFDYIVIDEFHHADASSYQRLLAKFKPKFLLGLTATPERMDGRDVLRICDYDIAFETRLFDAINNRWLVPFQYFAIHDPSDYKTLRWTSRGYIEAELDALLINDTRAELIFNNLIKFLPATGKIKALAFCASKTHADYMNKQFNYLGAKRGIKSVCLLGKDSIEDRTTAIQQLQDEQNALQIICSVDIFGEGIDIPAVSHVLFLRPTQSFTVFLQQLGRGLRQVPDKDYLVALDFVGNFKNSYVAQLAINGYTSTLEYKQHKNANTPEKSLPNACYISAETQVQRIWDKDIEHILKPINKFEALQDMYRDMRSNLEDSPALMDFFANPTSHDPSVYIKEKKFGGNWLRVKATMEDLTAYEASLLDTPAERFLQHIESELSPNKSYKMVVLKTLLALNDTHWPVADIAEGFLNYYLSNQDRLADWDELAKAKDPKQFALGKVITHLLKMPLDKMTNTGGEFFTLDKTKQTFSIQAAYQAYWQQPEFKTLLADRVDFALTKYFYRKDKGAALANNLKGFAVEIPYVSNPETGFTAEIRKVIATNPKATEWTFSFDKAGYNGTMELEILEGEKFIAWTHTQYKDITRFPARIKAAASALYFEGYRGGVSVDAGNIQITLLLTPITHHPYHSELL